MNRRLGAGVSIANLVALLTLVGVGGLLSAGLGSSLPIGVVLIGIGGVAMFLRPEVAASAMFAAVPFVFQPVELGSSEFSLLELVLVVGSFAIVGRLLAESLMEWGFAGFLTVAKPLDLTILALAVAIVGLLSLATVADRSHIAESERQLRVTILEPLLAILLVRTATLRNGRRLAIAGMVASGCAVALWAMSDVVLNRGVVIADGVSRARGPYPHPNNLALYLDRVSLFAVALVIAVPLTRRWWSVPALMLVLGAIAPLSRGSALAWMAGGAWIVWQCRPARGWSVYFAACAGGVLAFLLLAGGRLLDRGGSEATVSRLPIWRSSWRMASDHPWTGVGLDQYLYQYGRRYVEPAAWPERYTSHPHNVFLDFWLNLGLAGFALLAGFLAVAARQIHMGITSRAIGDHAIAIACGAALIGGFTHGMVDNSFFLPDLAAMTWGLIALATPAPRDRSR